MGLKYAALLALEAFWMKAELIARSLSNTYRDPLHLVPKTKTIAIPGWHIPPIQNTAIKAQPLKRSCAFV
jgi:hypothetical protein